jgi:homoserine kinase
VTRSAIALAPATVGNVGPGFDVLGLAVDGLFDTCRAELLPGGADEVVEVSGRDADLVPRDPAKNCASVAARALLDAAGERSGVRLWLHKRLPMAGGLGGSGASSVSGALAAAGALGLDLAAEQPRILAAALEGEGAAAGRIPDNVAPCLLGGLVLCRSIEPLDAVKVPVPADWHVALVTPAVRVETKAAREVLPASWDRPSWVRQMANTAALTLAFATGDAELLRRALDDRFAEPRRAALIPRFPEVKRAALAAGALGASISGSGPTTFAIATDRPSAERCARAMQEAFGAIDCAAHVGAIAKVGARLQ